ncbi:MAG: regulatory signaling modulator protein AmpE [Acidiferrobacterales bacterium]
MIEFLIASLLALALDRLVPDRVGLDPFGWYHEWADSIEQRFNTGTREQGWAALFLALLPISFAILISRYVLGEIGWLFRFIFDVVVLYFCLNLNRLNSQATELSNALESGRLLDANEHLRQLSGSSSRENETEISSASVKTVLFELNTTTIAPLFWFLFFGPVGAVTQRMCAVLDYMWGRDNEQFQEFGKPIISVNKILGWVPARLTALSFAIVGNFEEAINNWLRRSDAWSDNRDTLQAAGFGAMHLQYATEPEENDKTLDKPASGHVRRALALSWRVMFFWLIIVLLISVGDVLGIFAGW